MEDVKNYGDLSEQDLASFLAEIEDDDDSLQAIQCEASKNIELEDTKFSSSDEELSDAEIEAQYYTKFNLVSLDPKSQEYKDRMRELSKKAITQRLTGLKSERIKIQQEALNQDNIDLSEPIGEPNIKLLIELLVKEHTRLIDQYSYYINKRLTALLSPLIPKRLKLLKREYPNAMKVSPGFLYKASKEYGGGKTFWASPNIPYYFKQNTEQDILKRYKPELLVRIDIMVKSYNEHYCKRAEKELKYASRIYKNKVQTYFDLLKLNPFWYNILYHHLYDKE